MVESRKGRPWVLGLKSMKTYQAEVESVLKSIKPLSKPSIWKAEDYVGGGRSKLSFLDIKIPDIRAAFKQGFSFYRPNRKIFNQKDFAIFNFIWMNSQNHETLLVCLFYLKSLPFEIRQKNRKLILNWLKRVDNWALSDEISSLFAEFLDVDHGLLPLYKKWNKSKNSWERRQSLVGLLFYSRFRKTKHLNWPQIKSFIDPLLCDDDYYVQKAVGWTIREAYHWYPDLVFAYVVKNATVIDPVAWYACTEKMSIKEKNALKVKRRKRTRKIKLKK